MKIAFIIAAVLIAVGIIVFVAALWVCGWDFKKLGTSKFETAEHEINADFHSLSLDTEDADIVFRPSEDGECRVICYQKTKVRHTVSLSDGVLTVMAVDSRKWYDYIGFSFVNAKITVYLPKAQYDALTVKNDTGDICIPSDFSFGSLTASGSTGDFTCLASVGDTLTVKLSTGSIHVDGTSPRTASLTVSTGGLALCEVSCERLTVQASTGNVSLKNVTARQSLEVKATTGDIQISGAACGSLTARASTGDVTLRDVIAEARIDVKTSTGDIRLSECDAGELALKASTGSVKASLLTDKIVFASSDTGRIDIPKSSVGGRCEIETDTGNIRVTVGAGAS